MRINLEMAMDLLDEVVEAKGEDYNYLKENTNCTYQTFEDGRDYGHGANDDPVVPKCIVGHVLTSLGINFYYEKAGGLMNGSFSEDFVRRLQAVNSDLEVTAGAIAVLRTAQVVQDMGKTWGEARLAAQATQSALFAAGYANDYANA